jgi:hypothetical protein
MLTIYLLSEKLLRPYLHYRIDRQIFKDIQREQKEHALYGVVFCFELKGNW